MAIRGTQNQLRSSILRRRLAFSTQQRPIASLSRDEREFDPTLFVVAHEADIVRGPRGAYSADSLESSNEARTGDGLLKLSWEGLGDHEIWVDRYVSVLQALV